MGIDFLGFSSAEIDSETIFLIVTNHECSEQL